MAEIRWHISHITVGTQEIVILRREDWDEIVGILKEIGRLEAEYQPGPGEGRA